MSEDTNAELTPVSLERAIKDFMAAVYGDLGAPGNRGVPMRGQIEITPSPEPLGAAQDTE